MPFLVCLKILPNGSEFQLYMSITRLCLFLCSQPPFQSFLRILAEALVIGMPLLSAIAASLVTAGIAPIGHTT